LVVVAIPFRVGWGFSLPEGVIRRDGLSESLGWDGVFHWVNSPVQVVGWGFSPENPNDVISPPMEVAIPFTVGWGFSPADGAGKADAVGRSQSLSGWDGVFHPTARRYLAAAAIRNPFQGGMGFFTRRWSRRIRSQSLSGWDGVFHPKIQTTSQSLSGWDGVFHHTPLPRGTLLAERSQSLSGWDGVFH